MLKMSDIVDRFRVLSAKTTRESAQAVETEEFDPTEGQMELAASIGTTNEYTDGLKPLLEGRLRELDDLMPFCIESHAKLVDLHARRSEVRRFIELFESEGDRNGR